jgi:hypothetical protein
MTVTAAVVPAAADKKLFAQCFNRLAKAKRAKDIDAADMQIYYAVLSTYPLWAIEEASLELMRISTYGFPTTDVWVKQIQAEIARRNRENLSHRQREWKDECTVCKDAGWREHTCTWQERCGRKFCDQLGEKHEHQYYSACPCREHNSTYRRNTLASQLGHGNHEVKDKS